LCFACLGVWGALATLAIGCATAVSDDSLSGTGNVIDAGGLGADAKADGPHHSYNDSGASGDTGGGQGDDASTQDASLPPADGGGNDANSGVDANPQPDAAPPVDSGGGGGSVCPNNPIYSIEATAAILGSNPVMCTTNADCASTECCYAALVCVAQ